MHSTSYLTVLYYPFTSTFSYVAAEPTQQTDGHQQERVANETYDSIENLDSVSQQSVKSSIPILRVTSTRLKNAALLFLAIVMLGLAGMISYFLLIYKEALNLNSYKK